MLGVDSKRLLLRERPVLLLVVIPEVLDMIAILLALVIMDGEGGPLPTAEAGLVVDIGVGSPIITLERIMSRHRDGYTELLVDTIGVGARGDGPGIPCSHDDGGSLSAMAF